MKNNQIIAFSVLLLFITLLNNVYSQPIIDMPIKWQKPRWSGTIDMSSNSTKAWIVFSDRDNNPTYESPTSKKVKKTINFLDQFYVTEVDQSFLHIFKDGVGAEKYRKLGPSAEDYGWIKIDNVLPNQSCYFNSEDVSMKAILLNTTESAKGKPEEINDMDFRKVRFYKDPELTQLAEFECNIYQIFYIYKRYPSFQPYKSLLLGTSVKFGAFEKNIIVGWVDSKRLTIWNHRVAVIPNATQAAIKERKEKKVFATLFADEESARKFGIVLDFSALIKKE